MPNIPSGTTPFIITDSDKTYTLAGNAHRNTNNAIEIDDTAENDTLVIKGQVKATGDGFAGIVTNGLDITIEVNNGASVIGDFGIYSESPETSSTLKIVNNGLIDGDTYAIQTFDSREVVINHGTIKGKIDLGSGKDFFDNRGGHLDHKVAGGTGNDTLVVDNAATRLLENGGSAGYDTVKSTVSYVLSENVEQLILIGNGNTNATGNSDQSDLFGNAGNNKLFALGGADSLSGGKGNDKLTGGADGDTFVFKTGFDHDTITDFQNGLDEVNLVYWAAVESFSELKHHLTFDHGDAIIKAGDDVLVIRGLSKTELDASDFSFPL